ncbi:chaplin [Streptomyces sporangiiformans]|uniref:DUF320 domain-containing protein n=1 Tax=Streptomyces sporangiiformans TaxID=2315329 RepID=A0A505D7C5_9ACTN|nr:chaplin [Streptomyces sporangiiformans]TPQ18202.1 DUF320 domain-containing protein [Streptomyces sporangiiformans]
MRQVTRKGLMTVAAATGVLAVTGGAAYADAAADGAASDSPGVLSGNTVQVPVHTSVDVCGNTVNVIGLLNAAAGNSCANQGGGSASSTASDGGAQADGSTSDSPGVASGNNVQVPVDVPVSACGNSVNVVGLGNSTDSNGCGDASDGTVTTPVENEEPEAPSEPQVPETPAVPAQPAEPQTPETAVFPEEEAGSDDSRSHPAVQATTPLKETPQLAKTGSEVPIGLALPVGAGALLMGAVLYRKARAAA